MRVYFNSLGYMDKKIFNVLMQKLNNAELVDTTLRKDGAYSTYIEIDDKYADCARSDFNDDFSFNLQKYNERKTLERQQIYENRIIDKIRERYNINQELAILRQKDSKPIEYQEYYDYVELCKIEAKSEVLNDNNTIN